MSHENGRITRQRESWEESEFVLDGFKTLNKGAFMGFRSNSAPPSRKSYMANIRPSLLGLSLIPFALVNGILARSVFPIPLKFSDLEQNHAYALHIYGRVVPK